MHPKLQCSRQEHEVTDHMLLHRHYIPSFPAESTICPLLDIMITSPSALHLHNANSVFVDLLSEAEHSRVKLVSDYTPHCFGQLYSIFSDRPVKDASLAPLMFPHAADF